MLSLSQMVEIESALMEQEWRNRVSMQLINQLQHA